MYPNPTDGTLSVKTWYDTDDLSTYRIINLMGQTLMTGEVTQTIDVAALPTGIYVIQVNGMTRKFVKR